MGMPHEEPSASVSSDLYPGTDFLLAEFESSRDFIKHYRERADKRIDMLLVILTSVVGGLVLLSQLHVNPALMFMATTFVSLPIAMQAFYVTMDILKTDLVVTHHLEAIRRVRQFFAATYPDLAPSLFLVRSRAEVGQVEISSNRRIPEAICVIAVGGLVGSLWSGVVYLLRGRNDASTGVQGFLVGLLVAVLCAFVLEMKVGQRYKQLEEAFATQPPIAANPVSAHSR
jgi:hypothetical protein